MMTRAPFFRLRLPLAATAAAFFLSAAAPTGDATGEWLVADKSVLIRVIDCGGTLWGVISWESAKGGTDDYNPNPKKRGRPVLGMPILVDMKPRSANNWNGYIYNSENGHTYSGGIIMKAADVIRVRGCFFAILCGGEDWTRADSSHPRDLSGTDEMLCSQTDRTP